MKVNQNSEFGVLTDIEKIILTILVITISFTSIAFLAEPDNKNIYKKNHLTANNNIQNEEKLIQDIYYSSMDHSTTIPEEMDIKDLEIILKDFYESDMKTVEVENNYIYNKSIDELEKINSTKLVIDSTEEFKINNSLLNILK